MSAARSPVRPWLPPDMLEVAQRKPPPPVAHMPAPSPAWTEADVDAAAARGLLEGRRLAEEATGERTAQALARIADALPAALDAASHQASRIADDLAGVLVQAVAAAFPELEARLGPREVAGLAAAILPGLAREVAVSIHVAPGGVAALELLLQRLPQAARLALHLECDAAMGDADLRVAWRDGEAVRDGASIRGVVLSALGVLADRAAGEGADT